MKYSEEMPLQGHGALKASASEHVWQAGIVRFDRVYSKTSSSGWTNTFNLERRRLYVVQASQ